MVLGVITAAVQAESSGSLPSAHAPSTDSITSGKSGHFFHSHSNIVLHNQPTIEVVFPLNGTACLSIRGSSWVKLQAMGLARVRYPVSR